MSMRGTMMTMKVDEEKVEDEEVDYKLIRVNVAGEQNILRILMKVEDEKLWIRKFEDCKKVLDEKAEDEICAKLLSEWLGKEPPGSWSDDDVSMHDFSVLS